MYIDQRELKIKGTPEEIGEFKIELTATDAAGNGHRQGTGTPSNWLPTPVVLKLNITPRYGLVNPGMRMRVAQ